MRRTIAVIVILASLMVLPAGADARPKLSRAEARSSSIGALQGYYDETWTAGHNKEVGYATRKSRTRWGFNYQFETPYTQITCYGVVTAWRGRYGRIFTDVDPDPGQEDECL